MAFITHVKVEYMTATAQIPGEEKWKGTKAHFHYI